MNSVLKKVNKVYSKKNPSTYIQSFNQLKKFIKNREKLLLNLKLPKKIFKNSDLIDYGSGTGLNTIVYSDLGAKCTLVEYDSNSVKFSKNLFKKFSKNNYKIVKSDIFKAKINKKFDFVVSNGVAHHTKNPILNLKICTKSLKKGGFFILGIGETNGFFQRNLQRYILYSVCKNENEIIRFSKLLFKNHLNRAQKFSGRTKDEIIYDTYLNPKINTLSLFDIFQFFEKNKLEIYSFYGNLKKLDYFLQNNLIQFKSINKKAINKKIPSVKKNLNLYDIENFSLSNNKEFIFNNRIFNQMNALNSSLNKITKSVNDIEFKSKMKKLSLKKIDILNKKIKKVEKPHIIDKKHNLNFLKELKILVRIINKKNDVHIKIQKIKVFLLQCKFLLKGLNGTGMNYIVGYKK